MLVVLYSIILLVLLGMSTGCFFFFKQKTAYKMLISDWSSDVCSSDLREAGRRRALPAPRGERRKQTLRQFLRPVHRNLARAVHQRGVGEARHQVAAIGGDIESGGRRQGRLGLVPQGFDEATAVLGRDDLVDVIDPGKPAEIGDPRMRAVEQPQLGRSEEHTSELQPLMRISYAV